MYLCYVFLSTVLKNVRAPTFFMFQMEKDIDNYEKTGNIVTVFCR